jgi:ABC-type Fe3+-hydroxamate transport system substrate-binding protein
MDLSWWRDLVIVTWGLITIIAAIFICILALLLYKKLVPLVEDADIVVGKVGDAVDYTREEVISPVVQFTSAILGVAQAITLVADIFKRKEK